MRRGDLEFDHGEWVKAEEVADLYAIRCYEEVRFRPIFSLEHYGRDS